MTDGTDTALARELTGRVLVAAGIELNALWCDYARRGMQSPWFGTYDRRTQWLAPTPIMRTWSTT